MTMIHNTLDLPPSLYAFAMDIVERCRTSEPDRVVRLEFFLETSDVKQRFVALQENDAQEVVAGLAWVRDLAVRALAEPEGAEWGILFLLQGYHYLIVERARLRDAQARPQSPFVYVMH